MPPPLPSPITQPGELPLLKLAVLIPGVLKLSFLGGRTAGCPTMLVAVAAVADEFKGGPTAPGSVIWDPAGNAACWCCEDVEEAEEGRPVL
jgi:hypothetical protein